MFAIHIISKDSEVSNLILHDTPYAPKHNFKSGVLSRDLCPKYYVDDMESMQ